MYGQHQLLQVHQQSQAYHHQQQELENYSLLSNSSLSADSDLQPRALSANMLTSSNKQAITDKTNPTPTPTPNLPYKRTNAINLSCSDNGLAASNNSNLIVGSYHSVSDISVLSDNENDDSAFYSSNNNRASANNINNSNSSASNNFRGSESSLNKAAKNKLLSHSDDFEFLRPKDPPVPTTMSSQSSGHLSSSSMGRLEKMNYNNPNMFDSNNSLSSSLSSSYSPLPSSNNSAINNTLSNVSNNNSGNRGILVNKPPPSSSSNGLLNKKSEAYENSKSMMFGIPRDSPMPTAAPAINSDFHPMSLDSPFVDVTLNNCDDLSLYQPKSNFKASPQQYSSHLATMQQQQQLKPLPNQQAQLKQHGCASNHLASSTSSSSHSFQAQPYLNSSLSSGSSGSSSSNNSHHSAASSGHYTCSYQSMPHSYHAVSPNIHNFHQHQYDNANLQPAYLSQFINDNTSLHPDDMSGLYLSKDEQLSDQMFRMQQLQERMDSLHLASKQQQIGSDVYNQSKYEMSMTSNAISSLSGQIEERRHVLKSSLSHAYYQQRQQQQQQQQQQQSQQMKPALSSSNNYNHMQQMNMMQMQMNKQLSEENVARAYKEDPCSLSTNSLKSLSNYQTSSNNSMNYQVYANSQNRPAMNDARNELVQPLPVPKVQQAQMHPQPQQFSNHTHPVSSQEYQQQQQQARGNSYEGGANANLNQLNNLKNGENMRYDQNQYCGNDDEEDEEEEESEEEESEEEESEEDDEEEEESEDEDGEENVFGAMLKDMKQNNDWQTSIINSNQSTLITDSAPFKSAPQSRANNEDSSSSVYLPKLNYASMIIEGFDRNSSINADILANKYLMDRTAKPEQNFTNNFAYFNMNNYENSLSSTSTLVSNSIVSTNPKANDHVFPYYNKFNDNASTYLQSAQIASKSASNLAQQGNHFMPNLASSSTSNIANSQRNNQNDFTVDNISVLNGNNSAMVKNYNQAQNFQSNAAANNQMFNSRQVFNQQLPTSTPNQRLLNAQDVNYQNVQGGNNNNNNNQAKISNKNQDEDDDDSQDTDSDGNFWVFSKPNDSKEQNNHNNSNNKVRSEPKQVESKKKQKKKVVAQQRRNGNKDFSDQDEDLDRDVTTVLDIEKLKKLPKLL